MFKKTEDIALPPGSGNEPIYRKIYETFRAAIIKGTLVPGSRIPSVRALASELGVARGTIEMAYSLLAAEGYIQPKGQAGTIVTPNLHVWAAGNTSPSITGRKQTNLQASPEIMPFQMGLPALDAFPRKLWARLGAKHLRSMDVADLSYPANNGLPELRSAIAAYLQVARGVRCEPSQIFITSGYRESLNLVIQTLLQPNSNIWIEDPCYPLTREILVHSGLSYTPIPVDSDGINVTQGITQAPEASAAIVTPAHQSPLSVTLSLSRRQELLEWATRNQRWIIEDDYDGEYRYVSRPLSALKSLDLHNRVIYMGTFSKVMFPGIRLAYLVVPETQLSRFEEVNRVLGNGIPHVTQSIMSTFMHEGHFARHIQRMRRLYAERRTMTVAGLTEAFNHKLSIAPQPGGMHLLINTEGNQVDRLLSDKLVNQGIFADALSRWSIFSEHRSGLLLCFTNIKSEAEAKILGERIIDLL
ncbi:MULTISPECIES: PLP-dependent aminotransferase family protein [Morganella]|uniref:MocR-like pyridoxine biosynthesis transcription factor PdxR n=1 Tax=Morganella TaxID=581 RepID=UPI001C4773A5|nr:MULTISPECIES: PLP-dependent aminotransferase family protein [Morganella]QXO64794.1 PLP-dependent aminotransferase family protein [Morganella morganii]